MCPKLLSCPLCTQPHFSDIETLRNVLVDVATKMLDCPICNEAVLGLDKLTIHLFSHINSISEDFKPREAVVKHEENLNKKSGLVSPKRNDTFNVSQKRSRPSNAKSKPSLSPCAPTKLIKIYPKLPVFSVNTLPLIGISPTTAESNAIVYNQTYHVENSPLLNGTTSPLRQRCDMCGLHFIDENILKMHKKLIHNLDDCQSMLNKIPRFQCHLCPKNFKMRGSLMVHLRVAHFGIHNHISNKLENKVNSENLNNSANNSQVIAQLETMTEDKGSLTSNSASNDERVDGKQWFCDVCHKSFTTKYFLKKHKRLHTGETPYACSQCNKTFTFQQSYHKHLLYHNDEKPHCCSECGRSFKELSTLHNHQRIHTGEKPFCCETCGKSFRQRVSYLVHRRIHTGVMPYKCTACDKSFRYKVSQRTHKCPSQPPGTVVRQSGHLLQKLLNNKSIHTAVPEDLPPLPESNIDNEDLIRSGAKLSLEDTETENFSVVSKLYTNFDAESYDISQTHLATHNLFEDKGDCVTNGFDLNCLEGLIEDVPSPSEILKNLYLSNDDNNLNFKSEHTNISSNYINDTLILQQDLNY